MVALVAAGIEFAMFTSPDAGLAAILPFLALFPTAAIGLVAAFIYFRPSAQGTENARARAARRHRG